jgi:NADH-quinone oxidoreductase subunit A
MEIGNYGYVLVFLVGGCGFVCFNFTLASIVSRLIKSHRPSRSKGIAYECGEPPIGEAWVQYNVRYYLYAMLFVLFDVEAAFMLPWAAEFQTLYRQLGPIVLLEMFSFLGILGAALAYAWKKGILEWV